MKLKLFVLLVVALPLLSFGQGASVTIFSEDGDKFILYLNAVQQNKLPQANLRIDGLTQPYYKARIVFEDKAKANIEKNIPVNDGATNAPADAVYKIKNKDGEMKLRYYSSQPVQPNYTPTPDVYVVHYGQPDQGTVTQTTVTSTTNQNNGSVTFSTGFGGDNPNGNGGAGITQITTTTTTTSYSNSGNNANNQQTPPAGCQYPMDWGSFKSAKATVASASFEETKLSTAKSILAANCFNTDQVVQVCQLFGFEQSKLDFAKFAYSKTTDPGNYFKVGNVFSFDASKTDLNNFISNGGR
jgi:hypothetical protein